MKSREKGFTLLEVMIAVGILAIGLVVLLETHVLSLRTATRCELRTRAMLLAEKKMAELESRKERAFGVKEGDFVASASGFYWKEIISPVLVGNQKLTGLSMAEVIVSWKEGSREESVELTTCLLE